MLLQIGVGISFVALLVSISWLYLVLKKRKLIKRKEKFFQQNGGFLLQRELSRGITGSFDKAKFKIFMEEELKKATSNFSEDRIVGRGGYGTNHIVNDENKEQLREMAELARRCLSVKGEERPPMREVAMELKGLRMMHKHPWDNAVNPEETGSLLCGTSEAYK
ncbi:hypothetical protein Pint_08055 [Pistacia integerrima]|uniref:Uncharacterized protein n=1 Tax=Pistacia integerrima TaxID=434235 RepID=A0ACC0XU61_9ROSI|nr:hypothetical protein Pint_08055 [Pistacia integerrima]